MQAPGKVCGYEDLRRVAEEIGLDDESEEEVGLWLMKTYFEDAQEESREERCRCKPPCVRSIFKLVPWSSDSKRYNWQDTFVHFHVRWKNSSFVN